MAGDRKGHFALQTLRKSFEGALGAMPLLCHVESLQEQTTQIGRRTLALKSDCDAMALGDGLPECTCDECARTGFRWFSGGFRWFQMDVSLNWRCKR